MHGDVVNAFGTLNFDRIKEHSKPVRQLVLEEKLLTEEELNEILDPWAMTKPGIAAKHLLKK